MLSVHSRISPIAVLTDDLEFRLLHKRVSAAGKVPKAPRVPKTVPIYIQCGVHRNLTSGGCDIFSGHASSVTSCVRGHHSARHNTAYDTGFSGLQTDSVHCNTQICARVICTPGGVCVYVESPMCLRVQFRT